MTQGTGTPDDLLAQLARKDSSDQAYAALAAQSRNKSAAGPTRPADSDAKLADMISRIQQLATGEGAAQTGGQAQRLGPAALEPQSPAVVAPAVVARAGTPSQPGHSTPDNVGFLPKEPTSLNEAGLNESEVESLVLKFLLARGDATGHDVSDHICLPFVLVEHVLRRLKHDQLVVYRGSAAMNDYVYQLTDLGRERGRRHSSQCTYFGSAPVTLSAYIDSVTAQSLEHQNPSAHDLDRAFEDLLINRKMLSRLGPAINSGRGMFLYGAPGNGKTSIAERVTSAFGQYIWIPRAIGVDGEVLRLFDPLNHEECPLEQSSGLINDSRLDRRWVRIRRPTIVVGGELTMDNLEVTFNPATGISECPFQMKSNCGTLVIDDFGRQRMSTDELLNRWIVPLEKRYDFLNLSNGKKIKVPFDQLIVFSTNLEPRDLVDDAFLRRIPYKIEVTDPTEEEFRQLFKIMCPLMKFQYDEAAVEYCIDTHYRQVGRPFRCCQPRDLLLQIRNHCLYEKVEPRLSRESFDFAVENYFAVM